MNLGRATKNVFLDWLVRVVYAYKGGNNYAGDVLSVLKRARQCVLLKGECVAPFCRYLNLGWAKNSVFLI
jgi:hypothetical protein